MVGAGKLGGGREKLRTREHRHGKPERGREASHRILVVGAGGVGLGRPALLVVVVVVVVVL